MKTLFCIILGICGTLSAMAQQERKFIREGNEFFHQQDFEKAEVEYRKAVDKKSNSFEASFNMADALYKQKKYEEALKKFSELAERETDKERLGEIYHNIGNTLLSLEKTDESIEAYKESLRNRPSAEETKYNLEFARNKQQQQQNQNKDQQNQDQNKDQQNQDQNKDQQNQNQNKDQQNQDQNKDQQNQDQNKDQQNQDQNKDQQNQDQNKDQQNQDQNKDQQNQDQNKDQQNQDQQNQQSQGGKISKEDAERLLEALQNDEKGVQEKVQKQKAQEQKAKKMKIDKNW